jgi:D-sedoheptulose 7-phosphate isomerase
MGTLTLDRVSGMIHDSIAVKQALLADSALHDALLVVARLCIDALKAGNKIMLAGNGGSAADSQHIAAEFVSRFEFDRPGLASIALTTDTSMLTAIGNDYGYEYVFARQIEANGREGDVFIGISTSGNSKNVIAAVEAAHRRGIHTVALCGAGGRLPELCHYALRAPSTHTPRIQESHILMGHILCALCEEAMFPEHRPSR